MGLLSWQWCLGAVEFVLAFWCTDRLMRKKGIVPDWVADYLGQLPIDPQAEARYQEIVVQAQEKAERLASPRPHSPKIPPVSRLCTNCAQPYLHYGPQNIDPAGWCVRCRALQKHMDESLTTAKPGSKSSFLAMKVDLARETWERHQKNRPYMWL